MTSVPASFVTPSRTMSALAAVVAVFALAPGCSPGGAEPSPTAGGPTTPPTATSTPTPTPTPTPETPSEPVELGTKVEITPPDTYLGRDDSAVIEKHVGFDPEGEYYGEAQFTSRLLEVVEADPADLDAVDLGDDPVDPATETVYYVRSEHRLEWATTADVGTLMLPHLGGWAEDGTGGGDLLVFGVFEPCENGRLDSDDGPGATVESCDVVVLPSAQRLAYVGVTENPQLSRDAHETYEPHPVVWTLD